MNAHLYKHELIRQYWIIEISKEEWQIRIKDIVITYLGTILCESKIISDRHTIRISTCKVCIVCQPELSFPIYNDPEFNFPKTIKEA